MTRRQRRLPDLSRSGGFIGVAGLACVLFVDLASVPVLGGWLVAGLVLVWLVLLWVAIRLFTSRPRVVVLLPGLALALWVLAVALTVARR